MSVALLVLTSLWIGQTQNASAAAQVPEVAAPSAATLPGSWLQMFQNRAQRVTDTRRPGERAFSANEVRQMWFGAPGGSTAVLVNITVVARSQPGYAQMSSTRGMPSASILNFDPWAVKAKMTIMPLDANGFSYLKLTAESDVIIDIFGYYSPNFTSSSSFNPAFNQGLTESWGLRTLDRPVRVLDNKYVNLWNGEQVVVNHVCPNNDKALVNVTMNADSYGLLATGLGQSYNGFNGGVWSNLNFAPGIPISNLVPAHGLDYTLNFFGEGTGWLSVDVIGCFEPGGARYFAYKQPRRICDTRTNKGRCEWSRVTERLGRYVRATGSKPFVNVTATAPNTAGGIRTSPSWYDLFWLPWPWATDSNHVVEPTKNFWVLNWSVGGAGTHLIVDQVGYFQ